MSELHIEHHARLIPTPHEPVANLCWKRVLSSFFLYFLRSSYMSPCGWSYPRAEGHGAKKEVCFAHKILVFHFFHFLFCSWFCMMLPSMWPLRSKCEVFYFFSINFTRSIVLKFWVKTPVMKNNSSSLIITNMELRFEPCVLNLIWKWGAKVPKKREDHLVFINFGVKKFTLKNTHKKLWCLNVIIS
jgi:hypothetical protein